MAASQEDMNCTHGSFLSIVRPLIVVSRALGLAPVAITRDRRIAPSSIPTLYTCIMALVIPTLSVLTIAMIYDNYFTEEAAFWYINIRHSLSALVSFA